MPRWALDEFEIERLVGDLLRNLSRDERFTREQRRRLSKRKQFQAYVRSDPAVLRLMPGETWPLPFGRELAESGDLRCYILGEISREDANRKLWVHLTDPVMFYQTWFERHGRGNPLEARGDRLAGLLTELLEKHRSLLGEQSGLRAAVKHALAAKGEDALGSEDRAKVCQVQRDIRTFRDEITSPDELNSRVPAWRELYGEKSARVATQIVFALLHYKPRLERSDAIDFAHAMYLPHTDLWRGDRGFGSLLIRNKVDCWERVVPTLADLPGRIEAERLKPAA